MTDAELKRARLVVEHELRGGARDVGRALAWHIEALEARLEQVGTAVQLAAEEEQLARNALREQVRHLDEEGKQLQSKVKELQAALKLAHAGLQERAAAERSLSEVRRILGAGEVESTESAAMSVAAKAGLRVPGTISLDNGWGARPRVLRADVLNAFAVEENPAGALERYQREHPALAEDLAALARELAQPVREQEGPLSAEDEALVDAAVARLKLVKVVDPDAAPRSRLAPTSTPDVPPLAPPSTEGQDVDWRAVRLALNSGAKHGYVSEAVDALSRLHETHTACTPAEHACRVVSWVAREAARLGAEDVSARYLRTIAELSEEAHRNGDAAHDTLLALPLDVDAMADALPSFVARPRHLVEQRNGRIALRLEVSGLALVLLGDDSDRVARHLLAYLFGCPALRLVVVRENAEDVSDIGRPAVVPMPPAPVGDSGDTAS